MGNKANGHLSSTKKLSSRVQLAKMLAKAAREQQALAKADLRAARKSLRVARKVARKAKKAARKARKIGRSIIKA